MHACMFLSDLLMLERGGYVLLPIGMVGGYHAVKQISLPRSASSKRCGPRVRRNARPVFRRIAVVLLGSSWRWAGLT